MNNIYKPYVFIAIFSIIISSISCKKYEEDDYWITFRKPVKRILGTYHLKELVLNNINYTDSIVELWGMNTTFEFSDVHHYYITHDRPELNKGPKSIIVRFDQEFLTQNMFLPPMYRGIYDVPRRDRLQIILPNPQDLRIIESYGFDHNDSYSGFNREDYPRSINWIFDIIKIDETGLIFTNGNAYRIVFERIQ
jgi:hypothetical protein